MSTPTLQEIASTIPASIAQGHLGIKVRETESELVLRDATHDQIAIRKDQIKSRRPMETLMPSGLTDSLTDNELADLVRFLTELGRPHPP